MSLPRGTTCLAAMIMLVGVMWASTASAANTALPMYSDVFFDAIGVDLPIESFLPDSGLLRIVPACRDGLEPCFSTFTPLSMQASAFASADGQNIAGAFVTSSRGGLVKTVGGQATFHGAKWTDIEWMEVGIYLPNGCEDRDSGLRCGDGDQDLTVDSVDVNVPEPAALTLAALGLAGVVARARRLRPRRAR